MAVRNYKYDLYSQETNGLPIIKKAFDLVDDMQNELDKYTKLLELVKVDRVRVVKDNVDYSHFEFFLKAARQWHNMIHGKEKVDRRKKYAEKEMYDHLVSNLQKYIFGNRELSIKSFMSGGLEHYYEEIEIECAGTTFHLDIPIIKNIYVKNFDYANHGKLVLCEKTGEYCRRRIIASYEEEDIKNAIDNELNHGVVTVLL